MEANEWLNHATNPDKGDTVYHLRLFITGASPNSTRAIENIKTFCDKHLKDKYLLEIIDIHQQPQIAQKEQIIALPLLIKTGPGTNRRLIGDMTDTDKLLRCFDVMPE